MQLKYELSALIQEVQQNNRVNFSGTVPRGFSIKYFLRS